METDLEELANILRKARKSGKIKKEVASQLVLAMVSQLYDGNNIEMKNIPRKIHTVKDLYTFTEKEILNKFRYGKKTWLKLNKILIEYGLPSLKLPQVYTTDHQIR